MLSQMPLLKMVLTLAGFGLLATTVLAGGPVFWEVSRRDEILKGDARGVKITNSGLITLAPAFTMVYDTKEAYIWSSTSDDAGNIYLGTGHEGRIFKIGPGGAGHLVLDADELDVTALATDEQGNLFAGTSPDGRIYKITPDGRSSQFYDPPDKYIWSLAFDRATATLYAGTGDKGIIYKIDKDGKAVVLADTNETNIVSLALDGRGNVLAGTDPSGLVLQVSPNGSTFALIDSPMQEIHRLTVADDGTIFALGVNPEAAPRRPGAAGVSSTTSLSAEGVVTISTAGEPEGPGPVQTDLSSVLGAPPQRSARRAEGSRSAVFRITRDGGSEVYWSSPNVVGFAMDLSSSGELLIGTGQKGRIYSIAPDRSDALLIQSPEDQTSTILSVRGELFATSSNLGRLYRIGPQLDKEGVYTSPVHDAKFAGQWGVITWLGSGNVELQSRTGNTESPDTTWSNWSAVYRNPSGDSITSPRARFIQWRATLRYSDRPAGGQGGQGARSAPRPASDSQLESVVVAYLPRNQAPEVTSVTVLPPGIALQEMPLAVDPSIASSGLDPQLFGVAVNVPPRRFFQKGARSITWQASDPNDDPLVYRLSYRLAGDDTWHILADNLSQTYYTVDGNRLPDGSYQFKVHASDSPGNTLETAMSHESSADLIEIDNTPPVIVVSGPTLSGQAAEVVFDTADATSRIVRAEYSVNGGPWQLVYPVDGIADSSRERYVVRVTFDRPGEHIIAFRCADSSSNVGSSKVMVSVR